MLKLKKSNYNVEKYYERNTPNLSGRISPENTPLMKRGTEREKNRLNNVHNL